MWPVCRPYGRVCLTSPASTSQNVPKKQLNLIQTAQENLYQWSFRKQTVRWNMYQRQVQPQEPLNLHYTANLKVLTHTWCPIRLDLFVEPKHRNSLSAINSRRAREHSYARGCSRNQCPLFWPRTGGANKPLKMNMDVLCLLCFTHQGGFVLGA